MVSAFKVENLTRETSFPLADYDSQKDYGNHKITGHADYLFHNGIQTSKRS